MNSRIYPNSIFTREVNSLRAKMAKLSCPNCFSNEVFSDLNDDCTCRFCYSRFTFKSLLNHKQVREKKIDTILS
jgi:hypothetical protein